MRKLLMLLLLSSTAVFGSLYVPEKLGSLAVLNTPAGFAVMKDSKIHHLGPEAVDSTLRNMDFKQRSMFMMKGGISVNQASDEQYLLRADHSLKGGRAILGWIGYVLVMVPGLVVIALVKKADRSGTAPTKQMFENLNSVAKVVKSFGNSVPGPL